MIRHSWKGSWNKQVKLIKPELYIQCGAAVVNPELQCVADSKPLNAGVSIDSYI